MVTSWAIIRSPAGIDELYVGYITFRGPAADLLIKILLLWTSELCFWMNFVFAYKTFKGFLGIGSYPYIVFSNPIHLFGSCLAQYCLWFTKEVKVQLFAIVFWTTQSWKQFFKSTQAWFRILARGNGKTCLQYPFNVRTVQYFLTTSIYLLGISYRIPEINCYCYFYEEATSWNTGHTHGYSVSFSKCHKV